MMALHILGQSTSGLMLLILGMALKPDVLKGSFAHLRSWWPLLLIKLGLSPIVVLFAGFMDWSFGFESSRRDAGGRDAASIIRPYNRRPFGFDTETLAGAAAFMTVLSLLTIPLIHHLLT